MKIIGITGGVGAGKSEILSYLKDRYGAYVLLADVVANDLKQPGRNCYQPIVDLLGKDIVGEDGRIDNRKMAEKVFADSAVLEQVNAIIHPAVRTFIEEEIEKKKAEKTQIFVLEAALLIEQHYNEVVDEMWYIYTSDDVRRERLKRSRGYSDEKITSIMSQQMSEQDFRNGSDFVIDNSKDLAYTKQQIDQKMGEM